VTAANAGPIMADQSRMMRTAAEEWRLKLTRVSSATRSPMGRVP